MDRQILWDCHMHSSFSADSDTPMESMIQRAIELGIQGLLLRSILTLIIRLLLMVWIFLWIFHLIKKSL